jgi:hypothetical protein
MAPVLRSPRWPCATSECTEIATPYAPIERQSRGLILSPLFFVAHYVPTPELPAAIGNRRSRDVSEARARIEAALGTLALFEIVGVSRRRRHLMSRWPQMLASDGDRSCWSCRQRHDRKLKESV